MTQALKDTELTFGEVAFVSAAIRKNLQHRQIITKIFKIIHRQLFSIIVALQLFCFDAISISETQLV